MGERATGPYRSRGSWRVTTYLADGTRVDRAWTTEREALDFRDGFNSTARSNVQTVEEALERYEEHMIAKGNKPRSYAETMRRLRVFFAEPAKPLDHITVGLCQRAYDALVNATVPVLDDAGKVIGERPKYKPDSHRNYLAESRSFLRWCVSQRWLRANPLDEVHGVGRRSHGKAQLRIDEARAWRTKALELARAGEPGAIAAMMTLLMGMRTTEVVTREVRDLDDGGRLLWIPDSKTDAGRRTLEVPDDLRPLLRRQAGRRAGDAWLFPADVLGRLRTGRHDRKWPLTWVQTICAAAEVPRVTAHGMRGLIATLEMLRTGDLRGAAEALGHVDVDTTETSYAERGAAQGARARRGLQVLDGGRRGRGRRI